MFQVTMPLGLDRNRISCRLIPPSHHLLRHSSPLGQNGIRLHGLVDAVGIPLAKLGFLWTEALMNKLVRAAKQCFCPCLSTASFP